VGLSWVMPRQVVDLFACWRVLFGSPHSATVEDGACMPFVVFWKERNLRGPREDGGEALVFTLE
jgi:hypothetical protein